MIESRVLERCRTPEMWCSTFAEKGAHISERTLRAKARELGACYIVGGAMLITPEQIDIILEDGACHSNRTQEAKYGGRGGVSRSMGAPSRATSAKALEHLQRLARGNGSPRNSSRKSGAIS